MPKRTRDHQSWLVGKLTDPARAASYLNAARKDSQEMFFEALRDVAQARQMSKVAKDAGLTRESLYKVTSGAGNPRHSTFDAVLEALGLDYDIKPRIPASNRPRPPAVPSRRSTRFSANSRLKTIRHDAVAGHIPATEIGGIAIPGAGGTGVSNLQVAIGNAFGSEYIVGFSDNLLVEQQSRHSLDEPFDEVNIRQAEVPDVPGPLLGQAMGANSIHP